MLTHTCARHHETPAKNAATRPPGPSHWSIMAMRFQRYSPKTTPDTEVTTMPIIAMNERMSGNHSPCRQCLLRCGYVSYEVRDVNAHSRPARSATIQGPNDQRALLSSAHSGLLLPDLTATAGLYTYPDEHAQYSSRHHDDLGCEQPTVSVRGDEWQRELYAPDDEVGHHLLRRDADAVRYVVRQVPLARPLYTLCTVL